MVLLIHGQRTFVLTDKGIPCEVINNGNGLTFFRLTDEDQIETIMPLFQTKGIARTDEHLTELIKRSKKDAKTAED